MSTDMCSNEDLSSDDTIEDLPNHFTNTKIKRWSSANLLSNSTERSSTNEHNSPIHKDTNSNNNNNTQHSPSNSNISKLIDKNNTLTTSVWGFPLSPRVKNKGKFRYLKPDEIEQGLLPAYDFIIIANRSIQTTSVLEDDYVHNPDESLFESAQTTCSKVFCCCNSPERRGFSRLCLVNTPLLRECDDEYRHVVEKLCGEGLIVDIIDGGHSKGEIEAEYYILQIRAPDEIVDEYVQRFRIKAWMDYGSIADMEQDIVDRQRPPTSAERIQIVNYIIEHRCHVSIKDPCIHDMFPAHDETLTDSLMTKWIVSWKLHDSKVLKALRSNFGEKVAYYFAFMNYYNRSLVPIAFIGLLFEILHMTVLSTTVYMRLLPWWGLLVSVIWSFSFLKQWEKRNTAMQFEWNHKLIVKQIEYPNKYFHGEKRVNTLTGKVELYYAPWKRIPKFICMMVFMLFQIVIMLVLVAIWVTIYEMLKAKYKVSHIFSLQWWLILLEGIVFGLFVDVLQWQFMVTKMAKLFTHWENYRTEELFERALIHKLFLLAFLNYYTWFFSLAFLFVIPGFGNTIINSLNHAFFGDPMNCCFGRYVDQDGTCISCPVGPPDATCIECVGYFIFDRRHVDLSAMFLTPIVVTQSLNIILAVVVPILTKWRRQQAQRTADLRAQARVLDAGSMKILGSLDYEHTDRKGHRKSRTRYLEYTPKQIEVLNRKARQLLFISEQDSYDPYNDYHVLTVQFGFTVMFSILWPLMPVACLAINIIKSRTDGYRLCKTLKRPVPRKANGIGHWNKVFRAYAFIGIFVNVMLVCLSTGALEFYDSLCVRDISHQLEKHGKTLADFIMGPDFGCLSISYRLIAILVLEHVFLIVAYAVLRRIPDISTSIQDTMNLRELKFKRILKEHEDDLFPENYVSSIIRKAYGAHVDNNTKGLYVRKNPKETEKSEIKSRHGKQSNQSSTNKGFATYDTLPLDSLDSKENNQNTSGSNPSGRTNTGILPLLSIESGDSDIFRERTNLSLPSSNGIRSKARKDLASQWSADADNV